ncbi:hypothetical protein AAFF_G00060530 [Aldrovandia affinis]|uniref:Uncharacterized protein n=1 Tax=Aldrovandia affinis TaxID=143900 RepID=A0AAD7S079_9TELE|nr:hypothetical protein AAFF_G00060530 [Aldrovandia affinis]
METINAVAVFWKLSLLTGSKFHTGSGIRAQVGRWGGHLSHGSVLRLFWHAGTLATRPFISQLEGRSPPPIVVTFPPVATVMPPVSSRGRCSSRVTTGQSLEDPKP